MSENELLHQYVKHGDDSALSQLYELVRPRLQAYAYRLLNDEHKAQDIVNETFLRLRQQREQREKALASGQATTTSWLFAVARNSAIDELREIGLHKMDSYEGMIDSGNDPETQRAYKAANPSAHPHDSSHLGSQPSPSVEEILKVIGETEEMTDEEIENLRKLIQPHLWKPGYGKTAEGFPKRDKFDIEEFAKEEGISPAAAYQRMSRLQKKIRHVIGRVGGLAAFRALALRAVAWVRLLTNKQNLPRILAWFFILAGITTTFLVLKIAAPNSVTPIADHNFNPVNQILAETIPTPKAPKPNLNTTTSTPNTNSPLPAVGQHPRVGNAVNNSKALALDPPKHVTVLHEGLSQDKIQQIQNPLNRDHVGFYFDRVNERMNNNNWWKAYAPPLFFEETISDCLIVYVQYNDEVEGSKQARYVQSILIGVFPERSQRIKLVAVAVGGDPNSSHQEEIEVLIPAAFLSPISSF